MPLPDTSPEDRPEEAGPSLVTGVLARLPAADRQRAVSRRQHLQLRLGAVVLATLLLLACLGPQASNLATRTLAWLLAAGAAWQALVRVMLGGELLLPLLSTLCLVALSLVLWQEFLHVRSRGLR